VVSSAEASLYSGSAVPVMVMLMMMMGRKRRRRLLIRGLLCLFLNLIGYRLHVEIQPAFWLVLQPTLIV